MIFCGSYLKLHRLEDRLAPAGVVSPVSRADPSLLSDTGSNASFISRDPVTPQNAITRAVSDDGRFVAFASKSVNLIAGQVDDNGVYDVFVYDRLSNVTELISHRAGNAHLSGNGTAHYPAISADGRFVAFRSTASDLVAGMTKPIGSETNIFVYDRQTDTSKLVSHAAGDLLTGTSWNADL